MFCRHPLHPARFLLPLAGFLLPFSAPAQTTPTGREVMELYDAQQRTADSEVTIDMTLVNRGGNTRERVLTMWTRTREDGTRQILIRFQEPPDIEGTGFLQVERREEEDDLWLYLPALRRTRRIAGSARRDPFVGTHFTYEDLDPEDLDEHAYTVLRSEPVDGRSAWVVEAVPRGDAVEESGYQRRLLWIDRERNTLLRADLFDREGALGKRLTAGDVRRVASGERWRPHTLVMEDLVEGGRTVLRMREYLLDQGLDADRFTERFLRRGR